jgi:hypothetical protein
MIRRSEIRRPVIGTSRRQGVLSTFPSLTGIWLFLSDIGRRAIVIKEREQSQSLERSDAEISRLSPTPQSI